MSAASGVHVGIRDLAGVVARAIAVELVLFETFGRWIPTTSQARAKPLLAGASRRHAWHADLWRERFPLIPDADLDDWLAEARAELAPLVGGLAAFDALPAGAGRLAVVGFAATELGREYRAVRSAIDPLLDAPTSRLLDLLATDLESAPGATGGSGDLADDEHDALEALRAAATFPTLRVP